MNSVTESRRVSVQLPRPFVVGVTAAALVVAIGLPIGVRACQEQLVLQEIARLGGRCDCRCYAPSWLRQRFGDRPIPLLDSVIGVNLDFTRATDATLHSLSRLPTLESLAAGRVCQAFSRRHTGSAGRLETYPTWSGFSNLLGRILSGRLFVAGTVQPIEIWKRIPNLERTFSNSVGRAPEFCDPGFPK